MQRKCRYVAVIRRRNYKCRRSGSKKSGVSVARALLDRWHTAHTLLTAKHWHEHRKLKAFVCCCTNRTWRTSTSGCGISHVSRADVAYLQTFCTVTWNMDTWCRETFGRNSQHVQDVVVRTDATKMHNTYSKALIKYTKINRKREYCPNCQKVTGISYWWTSCISSKATDSNHAGSSWYWISGF